MISLGRSLVSSFLFWGAFLSSSHSSLLLPALPLYYILCMFCFLLSCFLHIFYFHGQTFYSPLLILGFPYMGVYRYSIDSRRFTNMLGGDCTFIARDYLKSWQYGRSWVDQGVGHCSRCDMSVLRCVSPSAEFSLHVFMEELSPKMGCGRLCDSSTGRSCRKLFFRLSVCMFLSVTYNFPNNLITGNRPFTLNLTFLDMPGGYLQRVVA